MRKCNRQLGRESRWELALPLHHSLTKAVIDALGLKKPSAQRAQDGFAVCRVKIHQDELFVDEWLRCRTRFGTMLVWLPWSNHPGSSARSIVSPPKILAQHSPWTYHRKAPRSLCMPSYKHWRRRTHLFPPE